MNRYDELAVLKKAGVLPRELGSSTPRDVAMNGSGWVLAILAAALFAGSAAVAVLASRASMQDVAQIQEFEREGREVDARITRVWRTSGEDKHNRAAYEFEAGGRTYKKEMNIPSRMWKTLKAGETLPVRFLPSNPKANHPVKLPKKALSIWLAILVPAGMIVIGGVIVACIRRSMELLANGRPALAVVTKVQNVKHQHGESIVVDYEFPLMSGGIGKGKCNWSTKGVVERATMCIVYDPNNPRRSARYPMQLVKVVRN